MANELAELQRTIGARRGARRATQALGRVEAKARALGRPVDYAVPGAVPALRQPKPKDCWATVATMMMSWRRQESLSIPAAMASVGPQYAELFATNVGLSAAEKPTFLARAGLVAEHPQSLDTEGWERLLRECGPIWVTTDEDPGPGFSIHARVMTGIHGDGTPAGTSVDLIDPADGSRRRERFDAFVAKFEEETRQTGRTRLQAVHWPRDAAMGVSKALARARLRAEQLSRARAAGVDPSEAEPEHGELQPGPQRVRVRAQSIALARPPMTAADARWAADEDSPDYRHLGAAGESRWFTLEAAVLEHLARLNRFDVGAGQDHVVFGLRGCTLESNVASLARSARITETQPNHVDNNCVIGVWKRSTREIACFQASTVPNWKYMEEHRQGTTKANLLPTGRYLLKVGTHRPGKPAQVVGALLEAQEELVLRTSDDLTYTVRDEWDRGWFGDNLHAGWLAIHGGASDEPDFSSAGCQTVPGASRGDRPSGGWAEFRAALGLDNEHPSAHDGRQYVYLLLTGREARLAADGTADDALTRLRFGSSGSDVVAVQQGLARAGFSPGAADGAWGAATSDAYVRWQQRRDGGAADGVVTPRSAGALGFELLAGRSLRVP